MEPIYGKNNKEELPLEFYLAKFREGDPEEMAARCRLPWDGGAVRLKLRFAKGGLVRYGYWDGGAWRWLEGSFPAGKSTWSGAKPALFARNTAGTASGGEGCFAYAHFEKEDC